jgi:hypothetical protein
MGIGPRDWEPAVDYPPLRIVRLRSPYLEYGIERHLISGVAVPVYSIPKSLADAFRSRRFVDRSVAVECLRNAIEQRKATPAELAQAAEDCGSLSLAPNVIVLGTFTNPYVFDYPLGVSGRTAVRPHGNGKHWTLYTPPLQPPESFSFRFAMTVVPKPMTVPLSPAYP